MRLFRPDAGAIVLGGVAVEKLNPRELRRNIAYMQQGAHHHRADFNTNPPWRGAKSVCFDLMLQKGFSYAGDWRASAPGAW